MAESEEEVENRGGSEEGSWFHVVLAARVWGVRLKVRVNFCEWYQNRFGLLTRDCASEWGGA